LSAHRGGVEACVASPATDVRRHHQRGNGPNPHVSGWVAVLTEAILTLGLVSVILGTASGARNIGANAALAIGGYIAPYRCGPLRSPELR